MQITIIIIQLGVINIDAHFDVREKKWIVSFRDTIRQLLEDETFQALNGHFTEFAVQGHQCSQKHCDYIQSKKNTNVVWLQRILEKHNRNSNYLSQLNFQIYGQNE